VFRYKGFISQYQQKKKLDIRMYYKINSDNAWYQQ